MKQILQNTSIAKFLSFTIIAILILSGELQAQPGTLDSSFGTNGKVVTTMSGYAFCTALQEDGKIIVAGLAKPEEVLILARYNIDGNLDSSFGENGKVLTDLVPGYNFNYSQAKALAFQKDGKIVVTGYGYRDIGLYSDYDILLVRYNADGSLDAGFGNNGVVINDFGDPNEFSYDVALQPDGKIVIGGLSGSMLVARYNTDGSPDITFGDVGWKKYNTGFANTIAIQPDAKIILGGVNSDKYTDRFMLCRIQSDGNVDNSFGNNGTVVTDFAPGSGDEQINSIVLQPDGKIIAGGSTDLENGNIALARYQLNGLLDTSFGINGKVTNHHTIITKTSV